MKILQRWAIEADDYRNLFAKQNGDWGMLSDQTMLFESETHAAKFAEALHGVAFEVELHVSVHRL